MVVIATRPEHAYALDCPPSIDAILSQYPWPVDRACSVVYCESTFNLYARSPGDLYLGWWQEDSAKGPPEARFDPEASTAIAFQLWLAAGGTFSHDWPTCGVF